MTQDTGIEEARIEEALRDTPEKIELPSEFTDGGDSEMVAKKVSSAGIKYLWDVETYEKVPILYYMIPAQMKKTLPDGRHRFSTVKPVGEPFRGKVKCLLHEDNPQRVYFKSVGFRACKKENIQSAHALTQHMRLKHPQEWKLIEEEKAKKEKDEDRALQTAILNKVAGGEPQEKVAIIDTKIESAPLYISEKPPKPRKKRTIK